MIENNEAKNEDMTENPQIVSGMVSSITCEHTNPHANTQKAHRTNTYTRFVASVLSGFENMQGHGIFVKVVLQLLLREEFITLI